MTKHYLLTLFMLFAIAMQSRGQTPTKTSNPLDQWTIRWNASDEFNGDSPDWAKWIKSGNLPNTSSWKWDNTNNVKIEDGVAELTMKHNPGNASDGGTYFKSGILKSYNTFTYGYYEARIKGAPLPGSGVCPSFWLFSDFNDSAPEGETIYSEIDVVELQQYDWYEGHQDDVRDMDLNLHAVVKRNGGREWRRPKQYPEEQLNKYRAPWDPRDDFHIYGAEVNETEIIWYVDGVEVGRKPNTYWNRPMNVTLSLGLRKPFVKFFDNRNNAIDPVTDPEANAALAHMPTSMYVDYVRVWEKEGTIAPPKTTFNNGGFEKGDFEDWEVLAGITNIDATNARTETYCASVSNGSVGQLVTLDANTEYTFTGYGKVDAAGTKSYMGVSKLAGNELIANFEFTSTAYVPGSITFTTGESEVYRFWYWSQVEAYGDDFALSGEECTTSVSGISVSPTSLSLDPGNTSAIQATVSPSGACNKSVTWSSSNENIATVNSSGVVTAVAFGSATITATTVDGGFAATTSVSVSNVSVPVTGVTVSPTSLNLEEGKTSNLTASVSPSNASNQSVTWTSGNTAVATVNASGLVTAVAEGTCSITATTSDGGFSATSSVTVSSASGGCTAPAWEPKAYSQGEQVSYNDRLYEVKWASGVKSGNCEPAACAGWTDLGACTGGGGPILPTGITINQSSLNLEEGQSSNLSATISPANADNKTVSWTSSSASVATVNSSGQVVGISAGSTTITATTHNGLSAMCTVTVTAPQVSVIGVVVSPTSLDLEEGASQALTATVSPANATNKSITWSSNNTSVASVSSSGTVTAQGAGTATITVTTQDGGFSASTFVTVTAIGGCNVPDWEAKAYSQGEQVLYNDLVYEVKWASGVKNGGCVPAACSGWIEIGPCSSARFLDDDDTQPIEGRLMVFPNPTKGRVNLDFGTNDSAKHVVLMNVQGKELKHWNTTDQSMELSLSEFKGIYLLKLEFNKESIVQKLIVN